MDIFRIRNEFNQARQHFSIIELYPTLEGKVYVKAALQPTPQQCYIVKIDFPDSYPNAMPRVYVIKPEINSAPHCYNTGSICYLHPSMWNPGIHNLLFVIQRATKWLAKYEVWKRNRIWPGAEIRH